jgi:hypothetical protein
MKKTFFSALAIALLASTSMVSASYAGSNETLSQAVAKKDVIDIASAHSLSSITVCLSSVCQ